MNVNMYSFSGHAYLLDESRPVSYKEKTLQIYGLTIEEVEKVLSLLSTETPAHSKANPEPAKTAAEEAKPPAVEKFPPPVAEEKPVVEEAPAHSDDDEEEEKPKPKKRGRPKGSKEKKKKEEEPPPPPPEEEEEDEDDDDDGGEEEEKPAKAVPNGFKVTPAIIEAMNEEKRIRGALGVLVDELDLETTDDLLACCKQIMDMGEDTVPKLARAANLQEVVERVGTSIGLD